LAVLTAILLPLVGVAIDRPTAHAEAPHEALPFIGRQAINEFNDLLELEF
jgi:hypothetical protein